MVKEFGRRDALSWTLQLQRLGYGEAKAMKQYLCNMMMDGEVSLACLGHRGRSEGPELQGLRGEAMTPSLMLECPAPHLET